MLTKSVIEAILVWPEDVNLGLIPNWFCNLGKVCPSGPVFLLTRSFLRFSSRSFSAGKCCDLYEEKYLRTYKPQMKAQFCQQINTLSHFAISLRKSALLLQVGITGVLLGVGHELKEMIIVNGETGYRWRGLVMKVVLGIIFHCNLSHTVHREMVGLHFLTQFAAQKTFVQFRLPL